MSKINLNYKPPFSQLERRIHLLVYSLFIILCLVLTLPLLYWQLLPNQLPFEWNDIGQPIEFKNKKEFIFNQWLYQIIILGFVHLYLRFCAVNPRFIRYGRVVASDDIERTYRLGRIGVLCFMTEYYVLLIYQSFCVCHAYFFGPSTLFRPIISIVFGVIQLLSLFIYLVFSSRKG